VLEEQDFTVEAAAAVAREARRRARRELVITAPLVYLAWGLVWLLGYGAMWLSVRDQHPYSGPSGVSLAAVFLLAGLAAATVAVNAGRARTGVDGGSARRRRVILLTWAIGYLILLITQSSISTSVSLRTMAVVGFAVPLMWAGAVYLLAAVLGRNRLAMMLGTWLLIVGIGCAWQAPAVILASCALAGGGAFLLVAGIEQGMRARAS
jgi:hypothetical protein